MRARLALPNQALSELADSDKADGVTSRMACVAELADAMNGRFFITMDLKDHLDEEYERAITSIMRIPPDDSTKIMEIFRAPNTFLSHFDELKQRIRSQQKKEWTFDRARLAREEFGSLFARHVKDLPRALDEMNAEWFWKIGFPEMNSKSKDHLSKMRRMPRRYSTAVMQSAYSCLNAFQEIFLPSMYGKHAGLLHEPDKNDWVDSYIASTSAYGHVLLTNDKRQARKVNHIGQHFGLRIRASTIEEWLDPSIPTFPSPVT